MKLTDDMLQQAISEALDKHMDDISKAAPHEFSDAFLARMEQEILPEAERKKNSRRRMPMLARAAMFALILGAAGLCAALCVQHFRKPPADDSGIAIASEPTVESTNADFVLAELSATPEGYTETKSDLSETQYIMQYENAEGDYFCIEQVALVLIEAPEMPTDEGESYFYQIALINGNEGYLVQAPDGTHCEIVWTTEGYAFTLTTTLPPEEAISLAKNVYVKDS